MLPLGMVVTFAGYGLASYGFLMVKGYNITFKQWFSPLHPFQGALNSNGYVPQGQLFPGSTPGAGGGGMAPPLSPVQKQQQKNLQGGAPNPHGTVQ
jgi:hypothetical protein